VNSERDVNVCRATMRETILAVAADLCGIGIMLAE
jgi:hypothetical protein